MRLIAFSATYIAVATITHNFVASEHIVNVRMMFVFDIRKIGVIFRYRVVPFVYVIIPVIGEVLVDERFIARVEVIVFVCLFFVGFGAGYLDVDDV